MSAIPSVRLDLKLTWHDFFCLNEAEHTSKRNLVVFSEKLMFNTNGKVEKSASKITEIKLKQIEEDINKCPKIRNLPEIKIALTTLKTRLLSKKYFLQNPCTERPYTQQDFDSGDYDMSSSEPHELTMLALWWPIPIEIPFEVHPDIPDIPDLRGMTEC